MKQFFLLLLCFSSLGSFAQKKKIDLLVFHAKIYTVDKTFSTATAMAVNQGRIVDVGEEKILMTRYSASQKLDGKGKYIYPGLIDAHAHFFHYGLGLQTADLVGTRSWGEALERLRAFSKTHPEGWLIGRGWDQNDWSIKEFPTKEKLDRLFPGRPVLLQRIDGHAAIANQKALDLAGVQPGFRLEGGEVETKDGQLTGILVDNAVELVGSKIPEPSLSQVRNALQQAQENCFAAGLTTVDDCGLSFRVILVMDSLQKAGQLKMRIYAMLSDEKENYAFASRNGKIKTPYLDVRAFKVYADGALGSRGACLLQPYSDKPGWSGFLLSSLAHFDSVANIIHNQGFQMCTHAIGDSGNRTILKLYAKYLKGENDLRWRIEHAQVIDQNDFALFGKYHIVPSVQPTHATSDMYWAKDRLGSKRVKGAYAYRQLLQQNGWLPLGTDFPVEDISPIRTFYAAVFRQDAEGFPKGGFQPENALSREQALRGMTIWAARANFEEGEKGSLEKGKLADFILCDQDLMTIPAREVLKTSVLATYLGGEKVYSRN